MAPTISVIVAARDAAQTLEACLISLRQLDYVGHEIVVADDGSGDDTADIARANGATVLELEPSGPSAARNAAVARSTSQIVAFTDADCTVPPHWLRALVTGLDRSGAASVGGPQRNVFARDGDTEAARGLDAFFRCASVVAEYTRGADTAREVDHNASCNSAYRRDVFLSVGGFAEGLWPGEDVDLDLRLRRRGHRCYYVPEAMVDHHRPSDDGWFARMMRRYGRAQRELIRRHGPFRRLHAVPVATTVLGLAQLLWLSGRTRTVAAMLDGGILAAGFAMLALRAPLTDWPAVVRYTAIATVEWHRGFIEG